MRKKLSFLHVADLHLDSPFKGLATIPPSLFDVLRQSTFRSFERIVQVAIQKQVDFILIVGDLYENERQSLKAQVFLQQCFEQLQAHQIQVYLSYGNHDYMNGNQYRLTFPSNVHVFWNEQIQTIPFMKEGEQLANIYGFSYENRTLTKNKANQFVIENDQIPFHIAMLHGSLHGIEGHDPYAPFQLSDLTSKHFHYWALGHIHQRQVLSHTPPIIYPGNIQGRHRNEAGEKGCYYVQMNESEVQTEFIRTEELQFTNVIIDITQIQTLDGIHAFIEKKLSAFKEVSTFIHLQIQASAKQNDVQHEILVKEMIDLWNETQESAQTFVYVYRVHIHYEELEQLPIVDLFMEEMMAVLQDDAMVEKNLAIVQNNRQLSRYINDMDTDAIREKAKQKLIQLLNEGEVHS